MAAATATSFSGSFATPFTVQVDAQWLACWDPAPAAYYFWDGASGLVTWKAPDGVSLAALPRPAAGEEKAEQQQEQPEQQQQHENATADEDKEEGNDDDDDATEQQQQQQSPPQKKRRASNTPAATDAAEDGDRNDSAATVATTTTSSVDPAVLQQWYQQYYVQYYTLYNPKNIPENANAAAAAAATAAAAAVYWAAATYKQSEHDDTAAAPALSQTQLSVPLSGPNGDTVNDNNNDDDDDAQGGDMRTEMVSLAQPLQSDLASQSDLPVKAVRRPDEPFTEYFVRATFNKRTRRMQAPTNKDHTHAAQASRQMDAFFDSKRWEATPGAPKQKGELAPQLSRQEMERLKREKKEKKGKRNNAWLFED